MPEFLTSPFNATTIAPAEVAIRLLIAVVFGAIVSWVYRRTRTDVAASFPPTLVLLAVLIAMVTQVIGDSVARAFSLVGALSIVRFRTVVRDTQDTAFVIFAVVVGMASGASDPRIALIGMGVVTAAAFVMRPRGEGAGATFVLTVRLGTGQDARATVTAAVGEFVDGMRLISVATARQGISIDASWSVQLRPGRHADEVVKAIVRIDGVQNVTIVAREDEAAA